MERPPRSRWLARFIVHRFQAGHSPTVRERRAARDAERAQAQAEVGAFIEDAKVRAQAVVGVLA